MKPSRIEDKGAMTIAGLAGRYDGETMRAIPELWQRFGPRIDAVEDKAGAASFGLVMRLMEGGGEITYIAGVAVSAIKRLPPDFISVQVPARRYAVFAHDGHVSELTATIGRVLDRWLPGSGYRVDGEPELIEFYGTAFDPQTGLGDMEIWIPVRE
jgi:AraC family transcriptional regulator